jgi:hypothetical protein
MTKNQNWSLDDDIKASLADIASESSESDAPAQGDDGVQHAGLPVAGQAKRGPEHRQAIRYSVKWKIALIFEDKENKPTYHGRTQDLSLTGTGMLTGNNLYSETSVIILLAPPPLHLGERQKIIEIKAHQQYVVYSGASRCWRLGFAFLEFKNDGFNVLRDRLQHHQPVTRTLVKPAY